MGFPKKNRVAVYRSNSDVRIEERDTPAIGAGELLLQVHASGVCGSDVMEWYRQPAAPTVLGHEVAGRVVAVGDGVEEFRTGDRVMATHHVPCLDCHYCRSGRETACEMLRHTRFDPGGFAELVLVPAINVERGVFKLPDTVSFEAGSMVEPLACVLRAQRKVGLVPGDTVLIIGAGVSGCLHIQAAQALGASRVYASEIRSARRRFAAGLGVDGVFDPDEPLRERLYGELGRGADRVIVCTGARAAIDQGLRCADRGGAVLFFAPLGPERSYPLPFDQVFWRNGVTLASSYGAAPRDLALALDLIATGRIDVERLITHRLPLDRTPQAFQMMVAGEGSLKIIVEPATKAAGDDPWRVEGTSSASRST